MFQPKAEKKLYFPGLCYFSQQKGKETSFIGLMWGMVIKLVDNRE